jgi:hypothetical protein
VREIYGTATLESLKGVPVAGILGDQQAAQLLGAIVGASLIPIS